MQVNITLSKKEKQHFFLYLLGMLFFTVLLISAVVLWNYPSPFEAADLHSVMTLQEKSKYDEAQKSFQIKSDSTFAKIMKYDPAKSSPVEENDLEMQINEVSTAFRTTNVTDTRKITYPQIGRFYKMFFDDKKNEMLIKKNTELFTKKFEDCTVGYRNNRQEMTARENAMIMSQGR